MITKITAQKLFLNQLNCFWFAKLTQEGKSVVTELPHLQLPVREKWQEQDRYNKRDFYNLNNYLRKDKPPRCRYYALQYKNRIYHVFNAYYYPMGRMIAQIATAIRGKNSPLYRNSQADVRNGDICVIINAADPLFTGKKLLFKNLKYHTGFVGHLKTFSYKHVLNHKPELLYYYLLRKFMPKNKLSSKYLQNLKIFRGPTHDLPHLPQFAPDRNIYEYLPQANLQQMIRLNPDIKLISQSEPGLAKEMYGRDFQFLKSKQQQQRQQQLLNKQAQDPSKLHVKTPQIKQKFSTSPKNIEKLKRKQQRILDRYKEVRAPYKKKNQEDQGYLYVKDQRKARKMEQYKILADQDLPQEDQEVIQDPFGRKAKQAKQAAQKKAAKQAAKK